EHSVVNNNEFTDNYDNELSDEKSYKTSEFASSNNLNNYVSQTYTLEAEQISQNNNTSNISLDSSELSNDDLDNKDKLANDESFEENVK
ncbi:hypothetical protein G3563_28870, partial [Escherichia coli]|nr:hypothetical protein [Escherichia coli]